MNKLYIHYGTKKFSKERFNQIKENNNSVCVGKPKYGFWASNVDSTFGWRDWVCSEYYYDDQDGWMKDIINHNSLVFQLKENAKVLYITKEEDILPYVSEIHRYPNGSLRYINSTIDYNKIIQLYDAMELCHDFNYDKLHYGLFYSWDVDSIVIFNPDIIEEVDPSSDICKDRLNKLIEYMNEFISKFNLHVHYEQYFEYPNSIKMVCDENGEEYILRYDDNVKSPTEWLLLQSDYTIPYDDVEQFINERRLDRDLINIK